MSQEQALERWLRTQLFRQGNDGPGLEKFVLRTATQGRGAVVEEFLVHGAPLTDEVPVMCQQVLMAAQRDADAQGSKLVSYALHAVQAGERGNRGGVMFRFRVRGDGEEDEGLGDEQPNERGLVAQVMRHNEALMRMATMGAQSTINNLTEQLKNANAEIIKLHAQRQEAFEAVESSKSLQHEREIHLLTVGNQEERKNAAFQKLASKVEVLLPIMFNKIAGKKVLTEEESSMLTPFIESLTEEQIRRVSQQLSPEQQVALFNIYKGVRDKAEKTTNGAS